MTIQDLKNMLSPFESYGITITEEFIIFSKGTKLRIIVTICYKEYPILL